MNILYEAIAESAARHGGKVALICENETVTYAGLMRMVNEKADRLPPLLKAATLPVRTDVESVVVLLACAKNGVCVMPLPFSTPREEQERLTHELFRERPEKLPFLLLQTSGTTGDPKLIMLSQETKVLRARQFAELYGVTADDEILVGTPLHYSMPMRLVFTALLYGATARLLPAYSPELWLEAAVECSVVVGVPQQLCCLEGTKFPFPRVVLSTSAPRADKFVSKTYYDCWGTSEIAIATSIRPMLAEQNDVGTAAPHVSVRISEEGEIQVKTPLVFDGYYKNPVATGVAFTADDYFCTGDTGYLDDNGALHLLGRLNDVIKVGGVKVYPEQVEEVVGKLPGVAECAAVGAPDEKLGEHVHVAIVMADPHASLTLRKIQHECVGKVPVAAFPRSFEFVSVLPRTENGKLLRRKLK